MNIDIVGYAAGFLVTASLLPQFLKSLRTKSTKDLSLWRWIMGVIGIFLWLTYGILLNSLPIIIVNSITILMACSILYLKIKYG